MPENTENVRGDYDPAEVVNIPTGSIKIVEFTHHSIDRLTNRGISREQIITTICDADSDVESVVAGRREARRAFGARRAKVVYIKVDAKVTVITALWESKRLPGRRK